MTQTIELNSISAQDIAEINQVIADRGYLVIGGVERYEKGAIVPRVKHRQVLIEHPFCVIEKTDQAEWLEQARAYGWRPDTAPRPGVIYYCHRVITD